MHETINRTERRTVQDSIQYILAQTGIGGDKWIVKETVGGEREGNISRVLTSDSLYWKGGFEMES